MIALVAGVTVLAGVVPALPFITAPAASAAPKATGAAYSHNANTGATHKRWMTTLAGSTPLSLLSLPGTHDTGARYGGDSTQTQSMLPATQLDAGIRALDIRLGKGASPCNSETLSVWHGLVCQKQSFTADILGPVKAFLTANPGETVVMRIQNTDINGPTSGGIMPDAEFTDRINNAWAQYPGLRMTGTQVNPTLDQMRGKVLVLQDYATPTGQVDGIAWSGLLPYMQDDYKVPTLFDRVHKWEAIQAHLIKTAASIDEHTYVNFLSGASLGAYPLAVADYTNPRTMDHLNAAGPVRAGLLFADFPGDGLITSIIAKNPCTCTLAPNPPTAVTATPGNKQVSLTWTAPVSSPFRPAPTSYLITPYKNGVAQPAVSTGSLPGWTVSGLTNGSSYTFRIAAKNAAGTGDLSAQSNAVIPTGPPPEANDSFSTPFTLVGPVDIRLSDANRGATREANEPMHYGNIGGASVWYRWTASSSVPVTITTTGTSFSHVLAVYTGTSVGALTEVAATASGASPATVTFTPTAGVTYRIAVDGTFSFTTGTARGTVGITLSVASVTVPGKPTGVQASAGSGQAIVTWVAPASDGYSPITGYVVTPVKGGTPQAAVTFNSIAQSQVLTGLQNGAAYTFTVAAKNAIGTGSASDPSSPVTPTAAPPPPPFNDNFADAANLPIDSYTYVANSTGATTEPGEPTPTDYDSGASTWAKITRPTPGRLTVDTCGTAFDTVMGIYTGSTLASLTPVAENDEGDCGPGPSKLTVDLNAGTTYYILVAGYDPPPLGDPQQGLIDFRWRFQTLPSAVATASATAGHGSSTVSWAPGYDGDSPITGYVVTPLLGGVAQSPVTFDDTDTTHEVPVAQGGSYTFKVAAKNEFGTGPQSGATSPVTVKAPFAPFPSWSALVTRQYQDLTGKAPTASELSSWATQLSNRTKTVGQLIDSLRRGTENTANVDPVARLYRAFLGRAPDAGGYKFWLNRRRTGTWTLNRIADSFATSNEFKTKYGAFSNRQFVTRIYTEVLGRTADPSGVDYWTKKLDTKARTRGGVMVGFSESNEYKRKQRETTDVSMAYILLLGRAPDTTETGTWVEAQLADPAGHDDLLMTLYLSEGYQARAGS